MRKIKNLIFASLLALTSGCMALPNKAVITINSEPPGARVYVGGSYYGQTPIKLEYLLTDEHYNSGGLLTGEFLVGRDGCLPAKKQFNLLVDSSWRPIKDRPTTGNQRFHYTELFVLEGDPRYTFTSNYNVNQNTNRDSDIGELNKALQAVHMIKSLSPSK